MSNLDGAYRLDHHSLRNEQGGMGFVFNFSLMSTKPGRETAVDDAREWCVHSFGPEDHSRYRWVTTHQVHIYHGADALLFKMRWHARSNTLGNLR